MDSFSSLFQSNFKDYSDTPQDINQYNLQFLNSHQPSFKELGAILETKDQDGNQFCLIKDNLNSHKNKEDDFFEQQVQVELKRYTSFQNGFMENHKEILKNSLQDFLKKALKLMKNSDSKPFETQITNDIKSIVFNENIFSHQQVCQNRERFLKKIDEFKILREQFQNEQNMDKVVLKDSILMGLWILKHTDQIVKEILDENSQCVDQVYQVKADLLEYLQKDDKISFLNRKVAQQVFGEKQFNLMIESWLYTLLIAKMGYFENDCFDADVSLGDHLKHLLKEQQRLHSVPQHNFENTSILDLQLPLKKRKP